VLFVFSLEKNFGSQIGNWTRERKVSLVASLLFFPHCLAASIESQTSRKGSERERMEGKAATSEGTAAELFAALRQGLEGSDKKETKDSEAGEAGASSPAQKEGGGRTSNNAKEGLKNDVEGETQANKQNQMLEKLAQEIEAETQKNTKTIAKLEEENRQNAERLKEIEHLKALTLTGQFVEPVDEVLKKRWLHLKMKKRKFRQLSLEESEEIKKKFGEESAQDLALRFGVSKATIYNHIKGRITKRKRGDQS